MFCLRLCVWQRGDNKESILHSYSLSPAATGARTGRGHSAADQILPVRLVVGSMLPPSLPPAWLGRLSSCRSAAVHQKKKRKMSAGVLLVRAYAYTTCMPCGHACFFFFFFFASCGSVFLTVLGPLQNKQWRSEPPEQPRCTQLPSDTA